MRSLRIGLIVGFSLVALWLGGCSDSFEDGEVPRQFRRDIRQLGRLIEDSSKDLPLFRQKEKITNAILAETNMVVRRAYVKMLHEMYTSLDISSLDYTKQKKAFLDVLHGPFGTSEYGVTPEEIADRYLSWLSWLRKQLDRLGPKYRIDYRSLEIDERRRYNEWNQAYYYIMTAFESRMRIVEQTLQERLFGELTESERSVFLKRFEDIMGRPIRSKEIIRSVKRMEMPEEKAVKNREVGPACFARETDSPVKFSPLEVPVCEPNAPAQAVDVDI